MSSEVAFFNEMVNELNRLIDNAMKKPCKRKLLKLLAVQGFEPRTCGL